jgi:hypothetical protein
VTRQRRLVLIDALVGGFVGFVFLIAGFGLAPVGIIAVLVLVALLASGVILRRRRARAARRAELRLRRRP